MEITIAWQSSDNFKVPKNLTLKEFLNEHNQSLKHYQLDSDYQLKLNNNNINKLTAKNQFNHLVNKFGNNFEVEPTESTFKKIEENREEITKLKEKLLTATNNLKKVSQTIHNQIDITLIEKKLFSLVRSIKDEFFQKLINKLTKVYDLYDQMIKESDEIKNNVIKLKTSEGLKTFTKMMNYILHDSFDLIYRYADLFVENQDLIKKLVGSLKNVFDETFKKVCEEVIDKLKDKPSYVHHSSDYDGIFSSTRDTLLYQRVSIHTTTPIFYKFEDEIEVGFSELDYQEINGIIQQYPDVMTLKTMFGDLNEEDFLTKCLELMIERDLFIYILYGVKMEDFINGKILYEN